MPPPNFSTSCRKIKHVITRRIALLIMEDGGCSSTFVKVTNPSVIKTTTKSPYINIYIYSPTELKKLYHLLGTNNRGPVKEVNQISLLYLRRPLLSTAHRGGEFTSAVVNICIVWTRGYVGGGLRFELVLQSGPHPLPKALVSLT